MDNIEKLELFELLRNLSEDEMFCVNLILVHLDDMLKEGIISESDLDNIANLPKDKQQKVIDFVSSKVNNHIRKEQDGKQQNK